MSATSEEVPILPKLLRHLLLTLLEKPKPSIHAPSEISARGLTDSFDSYFDEVFAKSATGAISTQDGDHEKETIPAGREDIKQYLSAIHKIWDPKTARVTDPDTSGMLGLECTLPGVVKPLWTLKFEAGAVGTTTTSPDGLKGVITNFHIVTHPKGPLARLIELSEWFSTLFTIPIRLFDAYFATAFAEDIKGSIVHQDTTDKAKYNDIKNEFLEIRTQWNPKGLGWKFTAFRNETKGNLKNKFGVAFEWDHPSKENTRVGFEAYDSVVDWSQKQITAIELAHYEYPLFKASEPSSPNPDE